MSDIRYCKYSYVCKQPSESIDTQVSMDKKENINENENLDPPPPRDISRENLGIWIGWTYRSNRELIREAASKGYISLAEKFLILRNNLSLRDAKEYIKIEVLTWVDDLLDRKLIYKVFNILESIGMDPIYELQNIFYKTKSNDIREYIGTHLKKINNLPNNYERMWDFLNIIWENKLLTNQSQLLGESIESLEKESDLWKKEVAAKLFLHTCDNRLVPLLNSEALWNQLVSYNEVHLIKSWIHINFSASPPKGSNIPEDFILIFKSSPITEEMIDKVIANMPLEGVEDVLNQLAKFGIFIEAEKCNLLNVLSRIQKSGSMSNIYEILGQKSSNLPLFKFFPMLVEYCLTHNLLIVLNTCTKSFDISVITPIKNSPHLSLMEDFRNLVTLFDEGQICDNIFKVSKYLSTDLENYFCDNPLIFLSLLLLTKDISIEKAMNEMSFRLYNVDLFNVLSNFINQSKLFSNFYSRRINGVSYNLTYFDLLEKHHAIDVKQVYSFHFNGTALPNFHLSKPKDAVAYSKKVNYSFNLKQCHPGIASKNFFLNLLRNNTPITEEHKNLAIKKVQKIVLMDFQNLALRATCVSFLEMIGINSDFFRVNIKAADILTSSGLDIGYVTNLFLNTEKDANVIQMLLDDAVVKLIDFHDMSQGDKFIKALKLYEIVIQFSALHNLSHPEKFLTHLSQNNLWFPFLIYAQMKNYPAEQIKLLCANFKNPNLLEHVVHSVAHDIQINETNFLMRERDSRQYLLFKLGVRRKIEKTSEGGSLTSKSTLSGSFESNMSSLELEPLEIDISNTKATLLQTLIRCHDSTDPPKALLQACYFYKNPLLAILATSYEPDSVITNWLTWLAVSTNLYEIFTNIEAFITSSQSVFNLLGACVKNRFCKTAFESFVIFIPNNPLTPFLDFLNEVIQKNYHVEYLIPKLDRFKHLNSGRRASMLNEKDYEMTYLKNKTWIEATAIHLLHTAIIYCTDSHFEQMEFIELLCDVNITNYFTCNISNFDILLNILRVLFNTKIKLDLKEYFDLSKQNEAVKNCINNLLKEELFTEALQVAKFANTNSDFIVLKKWQKNFEQRQDIRNFLMECNRDFTAEKVSPDYAISFFNERVSVNDLEKYYLLKSSHSWSVEHNLCNKYELEKQKILAFVNIDENLLSLNELIEVNDSNGCLTYKEMLGVLENICPLQERLSDDCAEKLNNILAKFLDQSNFWIALKLEKMFNCDSKDLDILKFCHELAEGLSPEHLSEERKRLIIDIRKISRVSYRRNFSYKTTSISSEKNYLELIQEEVYDEEPIHQNTLKLIAPLIEKLTHGSDLGYSIFMKYRISCNIEVPYDIVASNTDHISMLNIALQDDCTNKLEVVHDFLKVFQWSKEQITDFVCEQFVNSASNYAKSKIANFTMWDVKMDSQFHIILQLFKEECYMLGYKFYDYACVVHQQQISADLDFKISEMSLVVELLIAAHSCFTTDCNMEGISVILKKCRTVISHLLTVRSWKLIVRLFTGIGRYTELKFVFDILNENDQFEFLLSKDSKRDGTLKQACFEYLKKHCPEDRELYRIIAIHFNLYSDIANVHEREAKSCLKQLLAIIKMEVINRGIDSDSEQCYLLPKNVGTKLLLHKAMENYVLAAEYHAESHKLTDGMNAARQAELIALQKSLLHPLAENDTAIFLFNLSNSQIRLLISKEFSFHQSCILNEAYKYNPDWSLILYEQAIKHNNMKYFDDYIENMGFNEQLAQDISSKFISDPVKPETKLKNMSYIISKLRSVHTRYRLASELGFTELVGELISNEQISYLKDTVYKKGYKCDSFQRRFE